MTKDYDAMSIVERVCSVFSLLGCVFIIGTFCTYRAFHKPINRLVFYASFGNLMTNVATLMAMSYTTQPLSAACQFQAFLIQMFMPADAFWTLAMAVNVYLTFYYKFDSQKLRKMEIPYLLLCYGIPFVVALVYVFIEAEDKGRMYGDATLWCWITNRWDIFRIATFYGPVWIVIMVTCFIYVRAGREIYKKHKQLRDFSSHHEHEPLPPIDSPFSSSKTTEVYVTSEVANNNDMDLVSLGRRGSLTTTASAPPLPGAAYSVTISSARSQNPNRDSFDIGLPIQTNVEVSVIPPPTCHRNATAIAAANPAAIAAANPTGNRMRRRAAWEANNAAWSYTKCAILFFTAMLVTWIPSSANRVYSVVHSSQISLPLEYMSAFVLPLQGFWNAIVYVVTSWAACKMLMWEVAHPGETGAHVLDLVAIPSWMGGRRKSPADDKRTFWMMNSGMGERQGARVGGAGAGLRGYRASDVDSVMELAGSPTCLVRSDQPARSLRRERQPLS